MLPFLMPRCSTDSGIRAPRSEKLNQVRFTSPELGAHQSGLDASEIITHRMGLPIRTPMHIY